MRLSCGSLSPVERRARHRLNLLVVSLLTAALLPATGIPARPVRPVVPPPDALVSIPSSAIPSLSATLAADQAADYAVVPLPGRDDAFRAANPARHLTAAFLPEGVTITPDHPADAATATWAMHLAAIGSGDALLPVTPASPAVSDSRVEYRRGGVTEWYRNDPLGVEQGFTVAARPPGKQTGTSCSRWK